MIPIKPHAYAELPQDFYNLQNWQGFDNPLLVIENAELKNSQSQLGKTFNFKISLDMQDLAVISCRAA